MKKRIDKRNVIDRITLIAALSLTAVCTALLTLSYIGGYSEKTGYFDRNTVYTLFVIFAWIYTAGMLVLSMLGCVGRRMVYSDPPAAQYIAIGVGAVSALQSALTVAYIVKNGAQEGVGGVLQYLSIAFGVLGLVYFVLTFIDTEACPPVRALGAMCLVLYCVFRILTEYFRVDAPVNGDMKSLVMVTLVAIFMFFLCEAKRVLGAPSPVLYRFTATMTIMLGCAASVPIFVNVLQGSKADMDALGLALFMFAVAVYATARLCIGRVKAVVAMDTDGGEHTEGATAVVDIPAETEDDE